MTRVPESGVQSSEVNHPILTDPEKTLADLVDASRTIRERCRGRQWEVYRRLSHSVRVRKHARVDIANLEAGHESGTALRLRSSDGSATFGTTSGTGGEGISWLLDDADRARAEPEAPWPARSVSRCLDDRDERAPSLPSPSDLNTWLENAWLRYTEMAAERRGPPPLEHAWVESACTLECWVNSGGAQAMRLRSRSWATGLLGTLKGGEGRPRPLGVASRRWAELPVDGWRRLGADRTWPAGRSMPLPGETAILFSPESAGELVFALANALYLGDSSAQAAVGPGWHLVDDPEAPDSPMGGCFDDLLFPTRARILADGRRDVDVIVGPGHWRRPSYRNPPVALPTHLVIESTGASLPDRCVLATGLRVHALAPDRWLLEIEGGILEAGEPGPPITRSFVRTSPRELVQGCIASFGSARRVHRAVTTPALLFENLAS
jgi:hypothetical protein